MLLNELFIDFFCKYFSIDNKIFEGLLQNSSYNPAELTITINGVFLNQKDFDKIRFNFTAFRGDVNTGHLVSMVRIDEPSKMIRLFIYDSSTPKRLKEKLMALRFKNPHDQSREY